MAIEMLFPDALARPSWWKRRRRAIVAVLALAVVGSLMLAAQAFGAANPGYRTATVARHTVDAQLNGVGTFEPVSQSAVAFPTRGTVASVAVQVGDTVTAGQALASLDPDALTQTLHDREAELDQAELALQQALDGESVTGSGSTAGAGNPIQLTAAALPGSGTVSVAAAQQAVLAGQRKVDAALDVAAEALDSAGTVCAAAGVGSTTPLPTPPTADALTACQTATHSVLTAQQAVRAAQHQLADASNALDALLAQQAAASPPTDSPAGGATDDSGVPSGRDAASATSASSPSAADLVAYQKAVDAAEGQVAVAQQAIAQATIASPIAGTVEAVNLAVGDAVDAASDTANIVIVGAGSYEVTTTVTVDEVGDVKVGQAASLRPDGSKQVLAGTVTAISIAPDGDATTTSYRVVIGLADPAADLDNGATGSVAIITEQSRDALAVPTSAVTTLGDRHIVTVLDGSTTERVAVEVGVVGATWTEITSGVAAGQQVVLADLAEPLPGAATESSGSTANQPGAGQFRFGGPPTAFGGGPPGR